MTAKPPTPKDLAPRGRAFWRESVATFAFERAELELLREICRELDLIDRLRELVDAEGLSTAGSMGQTRVHPGLAEMRASRALVARLLAQLKLPDAEGGESVVSSQTARNRQAAEVRALDDQRAARLRGGGRG